MATKQANSCTKEATASSVGNGEESRLANAAPPHRRKSVLCETPVPPASAGAIVATSGQQRGAEAEALAAKFLAKQGVRIIQRNFRVKGGEIDLICRDGNMIVFVEVRLRANSRFGGATASITVHKQRRLIVAARHWLQANGDVPCRFDCILLNELNLAAIEWLRGAFSAD